MNCKYEKCNIETINGKELCEFHSPIDEKTISEDEFKTHITQMINKGDLNFQGYVFSIPVEIHGKAYNKSANFQDATFYKQVLISSTTFNKPVLFVDVEFKAGLKLTNVNFGARTDFTRSRFTGSYLTEEVGPASIYCEQVTFHSGVGFVESEFQHQVYFRHCRFHGGETNFFRCVFEGGADFSESLFQNQSTEFGHSTLKGAIASFSQCKFRSKIIRFTKTNFLSESTSFEDATFSETTALYFNGAKFFGDEASFRKLTFDGDLFQFNGASFECVRTIFTEMTIQAKEVTFPNCHFFSTSGTYFLDTNISADKIDFTHCKATSKIFTFAAATLQSEEISFQLFEFADGSCSFNKTKFSGSVLAFDYCDFHCDYLDFTEAQFESSRISFKGAKIDCNSVNFSNAYFGGNVIFRDNPISASMLFSDVLFGDSSSFSFASPKFKHSFTEAIVLLFIRVNFIPYKSFFERIYPGKDFDDNSLGWQPRLVFRYCNMKEIFLSENDMSMFSFYRSAFFEESFLISSTWRPMNDKIFARFRFTAFQRQYTIHEDLFFTGQYRLTENFHPIIKSKTADDFSYPIHHSEIAEMYLRFKSAADKAKDYNLASWFYFNEIEMKRRHLVTEIRSTKKLYARVTKRVFGLSWVYSLYKVLAGYGEKPIWSFIWFTIFTTFFSIIHLYNGISVKNQGESLKDINYKLSLTWPPPFEVELSDIFYSLAFTLSRIIPTNYFPGKPMDLSPLTGTPWDYLFSIFNSIVLVLMVVFVAIGLKRHFRRF